MTLALNHQITLGLALTLSSFPLLVLGAVG